PDQQNPTAHDMSNMPGMKMNMSQSAPEWMPSAHLSSGTGWQPAATTSHSWMKSLGTWELMAHGVIFVDYNQQGGLRGEGKAESVNWLMLMQQHTVGSGALLFREMLSAESLTAPHPGFPEIFQTGETYHGQALVDHQHPHNVFGELALDYNHPVAGRVSWLFYGGPSGNRRLGPWLIFIARRPQSCRWRPYRTISRTPRTSVSEYLPRVCLYIVSRSRARYSTAASPTRNATAFNSRRSTRGRPG